MPTLPGTPDCCWTATAPATAFERLAGVTDCETVVIGAGIVGLTTALRLCEEGRSVVVLEARQVGRQVTGRSTAKITTQHALIYAQLIEHFGRERAQAYADANLEATRQIAHWVKQLGIDCDYQPQLAYTYACADDGRARIEHEAEAARSLGLQARVLDRAPLPFPTTAALEFPDQAQFNPASYLVGLAHAVQARGGRVHEHTRANRFEQAGHWQVGFDGGAVNAEQVVMATNMTIQSPLGYAHRTQPRSHMAMAFRPRDGARIEGMFIGIEEPTHSIRMGQDREGPLLIVLGPRFNTGQEGDVARRFLELEEWARRQLPVGEAVWRWCNEDYDTPDRVAYVGQPDPQQAAGFHVATGFNAWGISNGTAAGLSIAHEIVTGSPRWGTLYDPARPEPKDFHQGGDSQSQVDDVAAIRPGEGGVITRGEEKIAAWRDDDGTLHAVSASCTHKGCTVTWNNADRTWDCPCHGSIFEAGGAVIHGPARAPLTRREL